MKNQMKIASFVFGTFFSSTLAFGDAMPSWNKLPDSGKNCSFENAFQDGAFTCGTRRHETWICLRPQSGGPAASEHYLLSGEIKSDVATTCSPVFVVQKVSKRLPK